VARLKAKTPLSRLGGAAAKSVRRVLSGNSENSSGWSLAPLVVVERSPFRVVTLRRLRYSGAWVARRPRSPSGDDVPTFARFGRVGREGLVGVEVEVTLDREAEGAAKVADLGHADENELR